MRGNCYVTSEALYHLLGGKAAGWKPMLLPRDVFFELERGRPPDLLCDYDVRILEKYDAHWFLRHDSGLILDPTIGQYPEGTALPYGKSKGCGFLTSAPSKAARALMEIMLWHRNQD